MSNEIDSYSPSSVKKIVINIVLLKLGLDSDDFVVMKYVHFISFVRLPFTDNCPELFDTHTHTNAHV